MATEEQILEAIAESLTLPAADIDMESHFQKDLGLNPVEVADLFSSLARKFNLFFDPAEMTQIKTVGSLVELIEDKLLE